MRVRPVLRSPLLLVLALLWISPGCLKGGGAASGPQADIPVHADTAVGQDGDSGCVPDCDNKACGDDGCGGTCGFCEVDLGCVEGLCVPCSCEGLACGLGACNEDCGACPVTMPYCYEGVCHVDCQTSCAGKQCGDDGCGGSCGGCSGNDKCDDEGQCVCQPDCHGKTCGTDGCGGSCGDCDPGQGCVNGACEPCTCNGKACGDDGCGVLCGVCSAPTPYCQGNQCSDQCTPDCAGTLCGPDGCGGYCGICPGAQDICLDGECACQPSCADTICGSDGCTGSCGACGAGTYCLAGGCLPCTCEGKACGDDGCGTDCGSCPAAEPWCHDGLCYEECQPDCKGATCGDDGCGGSCGSCDGALEACVDGQCVCQPSCAGKTCGDDGCGHFCGDCGDFAVCVGDQCEGCSCFGQPCGTNACGEACGSCPAQTPFCYKNLCSVQCVPDCSFRVCGDDGCGGSCGSCSGQEACADGQCACSGDCAGKECGDNGCGVSCGGCQGVGYCLGGQCQECDCGAAVCGVDPCGISCGICAAGEACEDGVCVEQNLPGQECGDLCTGHTMEALLCAMEMCYPSQLVDSTLQSPTGDDFSGSWNAIDHYGDPTNDLAPKSGGSYVILSTGKVLSLEHQDDLFGGDSKKDPWDGQQTQMHDAVELELKLIAPLGTTGFSFDMVLMSMEFKPAGTSYDDKVYVFLTAPGTTGGLKTIINFTPCKDPDAYYDFEDDGQTWCYLSPATAYQESCPAAETDLTGTGYGCSTFSNSTGWLRTTWPIYGGEFFTLTFHVHDTTDGKYDSTILLDNFQWIDTPLTSAGTAPI